MLKTVIRTLSKILFQTILETVLGLLAWALLNKMIEFYLAKTTSEVVSETDESTDSEEI